MIRYSHQRSVERLTTANMNGLNPTGFTHVIMKLTCVIVEGSPIYGLDSCSNSNASNLEQLSRILARSIYLGD